MSMTLKRILGCGGLLIVLCLSGAMSAQAQISPGPLSKAHDFLNGPGHCTSCHDLAKRPPEYKCLECHKEIRLRLDETRGLHPSLVGNDRTGRSCAACHSEHNGREFSIVHWDTPVAKFDHHRAGYTLEGKHKTLSCKSCHQPSHISSDSSGGIAVKDLSRTWLGLSPQCAGCHADEHHGQLGTNCERCHNSSRWQDAAQFDHDRARFTLTGAHARVACQKCHTRIDAPKPYAKYRDIAFSNCTPCHDDPHRGAFRQSCETCHATTAWKPTTGATAFNHSTTDYPLEGKHRDIACGACHRTANFKDPVAHNRCVDCHTRDPHHGQFSRRADGGDCAACHTIEGFKPSLFTAAKHALTRFPLADRHAGIPCAKCHAPKGENTIYRMGDIGCVVCHSDVHGGQFRGPPHENRCEGCHTAKEFTPSTFTLASHMKSRFPLSGAHIAVACTDCHKKRGDIYPPPPVKYHFADSRCDICHEDPHQGEFRLRMAVVSGPDSTAKGCQACHNTASWEALTGFDHDATGFPLEGAHRAVGCESCHKTRNLQTGLKTVVFNTAPKNCAACHEDVHGGQFSTGTGSADCARCHRLSKWTPSTFDHNTGSTYHLDGAHKNVPCALCHVATSEIAGRRVVIYRQTARECIACHGNTTTRS